MANTQTTTPTTRRAILAGIAATAAASTALAVPAAANAASDDEAVLAAWRSLRDLAVEWRRLDDEMWGIREDLPLWVKQPRVHIMRGKYSEEDFWASSVAEIDKYFPAVLPFTTTPKHDAERKASRDAKVAELEEIKRRAAAELERAGWAWRDRRQDEIDEIDSQYHRVIDNAIGAHPVIIAAKLWTALYFTPNGHFDDYPQRSIAGSIRGVLPLLPAEMQPAMTMIANAEPSTTMVDIERELALTA